MAGGILFFGTRDLKGTVDFYRNTVGMDLWLEQADCTILARGNLLLGFCRREAAEAAGIICFTLPSRMDVDAMRVRVGWSGETDPAFNETYGIYHFFARDPEDRRVEFQCFLGEVPPDPSSIALLRTRRSVRRFTADLVDDDRLRAVLETAAFAPSARNSQGCFYVRVRGTSKLQLLASVRGESSAPIAQAPMAIAVCADPGVTPRPMEDACIAATYLLLSASAHGLGSCWIGGLDRPDVKRILGIDERMVVATITPLGVPAETAAPKERRPLDLRDAPA